MVYKDLTYKLKIIIITLLFSLLTSYGISEIVYDKNKILITKIELDQYKRFYYQTSNNNIDDLNAIKNLVLLKKTIKKLEENKPEIILNLDQMILNEFGKDVFLNKIQRDFIRYLKIRNQFIIDYYNNDLKIDDFEKIVNSFAEFNIPISDNNCLTIIEIVDVKENADFIKSLYLSFMNDKKNINININKEKYSVCINDKNYKIIESQLIKYIEFNTEDEFKKFIYND